MKRIISFFIMTSGLFLFMSCPSPSDDPPDYYSLSIATDTAYVPVSEIEKIPDYDRYESGSRVTLRAHSIPHYLFQVWTGDAGGTDNPLTITMNSDKDIIAGYGYCETTYNLSIFTSPDSSYGFIIPYPNRTEINEGETVTLTAVPAPGYKFVEWDTGPTDTTIEFVMTNDETVTGIFDVNMDYIYFVDDALSYVNNNKGAPVNNIFDIEGHDIGDVYIIPSQAGGTGNCTFQDINYIDDNGTVEDDTDDIHYEIKIYDFSNFRKDDYTISSIDSENVFTFYHKYYRIDFTNIEGWRKGIFLVDTDVNQEPAERAEVEYHLTYLPVPYLHLDTDPANTYYRIGDMYFDYTKNPI